MIDQWAAGWAAARLAGKRPFMPLLPEDDLSSILQYLRDMLDELASDMRSVEWRLVKLERQYGALPSD